MSKIKINNGEYEEVQKHVDLAKREIEGAMDEVWSTNFSNLYHNFITNGFLKDLYVDAESKFNLLFGGGTAIICGVGAYTAGTAAAGAAAAVTTASVSACIPVVGWIIAAVILAILAVVGIYHCIKSASDVQFKHDAEKVFIDLLTECNDGSQMNYSSMENIETKMENVRLSLQKILLKIDEFNGKYADLSQAASEANVKTILADENMTVLGIETSVKIDGVEKALTTSEALNAFYTYSNTVMSGEIAADYLAREYGYDINYSDVVKKANSFMSNTIQSGLYTHEFVEGILPEYSASLDEAYNAIGSVTGIDLDKIESTLNNNAALAGSVALFGGLLGSALVGTLGSNSKSDEINSAINNGGGSSGGSSSGGGYPNGGGGGSGGGSSIPVTPDPEDPEDPEEPILPPEDPEEPEEPVLPPEEPEEPVGPSNDIIIEEIFDDIDLPEKVETELYEDGNIDYDEIARNEFEFDSDYEKILQNRTEIVNELEEKFALGDLGDIKAELKEYGYSDPEIESIIADKDLTIRAILEGDQKAQIAHRACELAAKDGVKDYVSSYEQRPDYNDLTKEGPSEILLLASEDKQVVDAKYKMDDAAIKYDNAVKETNNMLTKVQEDKKLMLEIKERYEKEYGTDTTKWTEEAALEYNESIKTYNESLTKASEQVKLVDEAKNSYNEAKKIVLILVSNKLLC